MDLLTIILIFITFVSIILTIFTTIGMFKGLKKVEYYEETLADVKKRIFETYKQMTEIDRIGAFESDDEVGIVFDELKTLVYELQNYINEEEENINLQKENING